MNKIDIQYRTITDDLTIDIYGTKLGQTCKRRWTVGFYHLHFAKQFLG